MKIPSFVRSSSAFFAGLLLAMSLQTALADPGSTPPSGNVSPSFYSVTVEDSLGSFYNTTDTTYFYGVDKDVAGGIHINKSDVEYYGSLYGYDGYIGSLVDRASGSAIWGWNTNTGNSVKAIQGWLDGGNTKGILGYRDSGGLEHGVYGYKASATEGESGVQGTITTTGGAAAGTTTTTGFLGYVGKSNSYGVYTSGIVYGTTLQAADGSGAVYTDNINANSTVLSVTASGGTNFSGPVTAESFGTFDYDYTTASSDSTYVTKTCDGTDEILIACSGRSTVDNFLGAYQSGSTTCYARRSDTSGTLYVYAYCFDPTQ